MMLLASKNRKNGTNNERYNPLRVYIYPATCTRTPTTRLDATVSSSSKSTGGGKKTPSSSSIDKFLSKCYSFGNNREQVTNDGDTDGPDDSCDESLNTNKLLPTLIVDGNNVRGMGKFEWNMLDVHIRVDWFCRKFNIPQAIIVWDHGSERLACQLGGPMMMMDNDSHSHGSTNNNHIKEESSNENINKNTTATTRTNMNNSNNKNRTDIVVLFSGLYKRADDIIVQESMNIVSSFLHRENLLCWSLLGFVTNDIGLGQRIRQKSSTITGTASSSSATTNSLSTIKEENPMFFDSTRFVAILKEEFDDDDDDNNIDSVINDDDDDDDVTMKEHYNELFVSLQQAEEKVYDFSRDYKGGRHHHGGGRGGVSRLFNPRHERTWERCIWAETFQRALIRVHDKQQQQQQQQGRHEQNQSHITTKTKKRTNDNCNAVDTSSFSYRYLEYLKNGCDHDYTVLTSGCTTTATTTTSSSSSNQEKIDNDSDNDNKKNDIFYILDGTIPGPTRLDKRQRRLLNSFNKYCLKKSKIPQPERQNHNPKKKK